ALWLKRNNFKLDQVQTFTPTPMAMATAMYHSGKNPLRKVTDSSEDVPIPRAGGVRRLHKAFIRYHDPNNWPMLREALKRMGREDLIGSGKKHLVPAWQPIAVKPTSASARAKTPAARANPGSARTKPAKVMSKKTHRLPHHK
ncbi:MAG: YgiQ family radical SAM protein, partial [Betaproteobacteria bacterium HGW-Betaproteobacteria-2]